MATTSKKRMTLIEVEELFLQNAKSFLSVKTDAEELSGKGTLEYARNKRSDEDEFVHAL